MLTKLHMQIPYGHGHTNTLLSVLLGIPHGHHNTLLSVPLGIPSGTDKRVSVCPWPSGPRKMSGPQVEVIEGGKYVFQQACSDDGFILSQ